MHKKSNKAPLEDGPVALGMVAAVPLRLGGMNSDFNEPLSTECFLGQKILILPTEKVRFFNSFACIHVTDTSY